MSVRKSRRTPPVEPATQALETVRIVERIVVDALPRRPSIREIAREAGIAANEINQAFRQTYDTTLYARLLSLRLEAAERLFASDPELSPTSVALQCGFTHQGGFDRNYRLRFGRSPGSLRPEDIGGRDEAEVEPPTLPSL